jgi:YHS domain-containing protein
VTKDPVCGMEIDKRAQRMSTFNGRTYYFCSDSCKKRFDEAPGMFAKDLDAGHGPRAA